MSAKKQTKILANYILGETQHLPEPDEGAGDTAIRLLKRYRQTLRFIMSELGVPGDGYPAPVVNAVDAARAALFDV